MKAVLSGFAGSAPRSASQNLIELLSTLLNRYPAESRIWMSDVLYAVRQLSVNMRQHTH